MNDQEKTAKRQEILAEMCKLIDELSKLDEVGEER